MGIKNYIRNKIGSKAKNKKSAGEKGEDIACMFLKKNGYKIRKKNYSSKFGELDIIADEADTLCFVEVKSRSSMDHGRPEEFVDGRKQHKLVKTALTYISKNNINDRDMRFDIVSVDLNSSESRLLKNAFQISDDY